MFRMRKTEGFFFKKKFELKSIYIELTDDSENCLGLVGMNSIMF
jgi:hypothetical protein